MTVFAYYRVSTDKQDFTSQQYGVLEFCRYKGLTIEKEIVDDGISGTILASKRKLGGLLKVLRAGDILVIAELSRLGRNTCDVLNTCRVLMEKNVNVYFVKESMYLDNTPMGNMMITIFSAFSQLERDLISQRTKEALAKKKDSGIVLGRPKGAKSSRTKLSGKDGLIKRMLKQKMTKTVMAKKLGVSRATLRKYIISDAMAGGMKNSKS